MFCKNCGKEIDNNAKFCMYCGKSINEEDNKENDKVNKKEDTDKMFYSIIMGVIVIVAIIAIIIAIILVSDNTVKNSNKTKEVNLREVYSEVLLENREYSKFINIASDNSYIEIDTKPNNIDGDDYYFEDAWKLVKAINKKLGFNESLENKMEHTRSLDGKQSEKSNNIEVTWTYHPNNGLEIQYTKSK